MGFCFGVWSWVFCFCLLVLRMGGVGVWLGWSWGGRGVGCVLFFVRLEIRKMFVEFGCWCSSV